MSSSSDIFGSVLTKLSALVRILVWEYILKYENYLDSCRLSSILIDGQHRVVRDSRYGTSPLSAVDAWIKRLFQWTGRGQALRIDSAAVTPDMPFIPSTEE